MIEPKVDRSVTFSLFLFKAGALFVGECGDEPIWFSWYGHVSAGFMTGAQAPCAIIGNVSEGYRPYQVCQLDFKRITDDPRTGHLCG